MQKLLGLIILVAVSILSVACGNSSVAAPEARANEEHSMTDDSSHDMEHNDGQEHAAGGTHIHATAPESYANLTNPLANDPEAADSGKIIFEAQCAVCHGPQGHGDGAAAAGLKPQPANLADSKMLDSLSDGYLFWRVSEGGVMAPFNSGMPAWKATLSEEQRWQVISYIRLLGR